jgi:transposase
MNEIASRLSVSKGSVYKIKQTFVPSRVGCASGRPRCLSYRQESFIVRKVTSGELDTAVDATKILQENEQGCVHPKTIRRVLKRHGLHARVKVKKPLLRLKHVRARLRFARMYSDWTAKDWERVIWSDEIKIN